MTEEEWLACRDPDALLEFLLSEAACRHRPQPSRRKLRLFACACCRRIWPFLTDDCSRHAVEVAERHADRLATREQLALAFLEAKTLKPIGNAGSAAVAAATPSGRLDRAATHAALAVDVSAWAAERAAQALLVRDLFGNPFRPVPILHPAWLACANRSIPERARAIYADRAFDRLSALADDLVEAGCTDVEFLEHLCAPGPHARGCWAVDTLADKE
jgi:hypothetical protein